MGLQSETIENSNIKLRKIQRNRAFTILFFLVFASICAAAAINYTSIYDPYSIQSIGTRSLNVTNASVCASNSSVCQEANTETALSLITIGIVTFFKGAIGIVASVIGMLVNIVLTFLLNIFFVILSYFPDLYSSTLLCEYNKVYSLVASFYSIAIVIIGLFWVFGAKSSSSRIQAKEYTELLFFLILAETIGPFLFGLLIDLSMSLTKIFLNQDTIDSFASNIFSGGAMTAMIEILAKDPFGIILGIITIALLIILIVMVMLRNLMVVIMYVIFPITIFLYFLPFTKRIGAGLLKYTVTLIFSSFIIGLIIYATTIAKAAVLGPFLGVILSSLYLAMVIYIIYKVLSAIVIGGLTNLLSDITGGNIGSLLPSASGLATAAAAYAMGPAGAAGKFASSSLLGRLPIYQARTGLQKYIEKEARGFAKSKSIPYDKPLIKLPKVLGKKK